MITVSDGEKVYYLIEKRKSKISEVVKIAFELCGSVFSITSAKKHDEYGNYLVDRDEGEYWCIEREL